MPSPVAAGEGLLDEVKTVGVALADQVRRGRHRHVVVADVPLAHDALVTAQSLELLSGHQFVSHLLS